MDDAHLLRSPKSGTLQICLGLLTIGLLFSSFLLAILVYVAEGRDLTVDLTLGQAAFLGVSERLEQSARLSVDRGEAVELLGRVKRFARLRSETWRPIAASLERKILKRDEAVGILWSSFFFFYFALVTMSTLTLVATGAFGTSEQPTREEKRPPLPDAPVPDHS